MDGRLETAKRPPDSRQPLHHLRKPHDRDFAGLHQALHAGSLERWSAHALHVKRRMQNIQRTNHLGTQEISRSLSRHNEEPQWTCSIGHHAATVTD